MSRGLTGSIERSWSGAPGTVPWTWALLPFAFLYGAGSAFSRARAKRMRRRLPELRVIAVGGLTVGGSGKSSLANWMASHIHLMGARSAILLRGHRATRPSEEPYVVPDFRSYPMSEASARGGDEAAAHRRSLYRGYSGCIHVVAHRDRYASAKVVHAGYDAHIMILDDGWEQPWLQWDELWAVVDPDLPVGNGALLPAGPLRRPVSSLREANVVALVFEEEADTARGQAVERVRAWAPDADIVRFRRTLDYASPLGDRGRKSVGSTEEGAIQLLRPAGLVSGIGAPERLERFARAAGIRVVSHAAFQDHASWTSRQIESAVEEAARRGAEVIVTTEKDEARWPANTTCPFPVHVLRTRLEPLDDSPLILMRAMGMISQPDLDRLRSTRNP